MRFKDHVYEHDTIAIGGTLEAVVYCYLSNTPLVYTNLKVPFRFDRFDSEFDLKDIKGVGKSKAEIHKRFLFILSLSGLVPFSNMASSLRLKPECLKIITVNNSSVSIEFEKLIIFDDEGLSWLPEPEKTEIQKRKVIDWINVRSGMNHKFDYYHTKEDFVNEIYFYPSDRIDGNHLNKKDIVCVSYLSEDEIRSGEFSETYVKFKVTDIMKELGIKGRGNGWDHSTGRKLYRSIVIEPSHREIINQDIRVYDDKENIIFMNNQKVEEIIKNNSLIESYNSKLNNYLYNIKRKKA